MFSNFLSHEPLLEEDAVQWIFASYAWALRNFDATVFYDETILVTPSSEHFPGRESSVQGMASLIFERVRAYAGMQHWPFQLVAGDLCQQPAAAPPLIEGALRGSKGIAPVDGEAAQQLMISYDPQAVGNPEAMIAGFAHSLAHHLGSMATEPPPGGLQNWPHLTEILAVFMGFGLMFANSAFNVRTRSCGSCGGSAAERYNFLSQYDITYALALFCVLKEIPNRDATPHLKKSLRGFFRRSVKEIHGRTAELERLRGIA